MTYYKLDSYQFVQHITVTCYCLNNSSSITAKKKWGMFRIKTLQFGTVRMPLQNCSTWLVDRIFTLTLPVIVAETNLHGTPASYLSSFLASSS